MGGPLHRMTALRLVLALLVLALPRPVDAQIYAWRDAAGQMVLSDRPPVPGTAVQTFDVPKTRGVRVTRPPTRASAKFDPFIDEHATANGVDPDLVRAVIQVESAFNPHAVSPKGAMGLMQLMPATAVELGVANPFDPAENIGGGVRYLKRLLARYDDQVELALAAYNAGPGAVDKYGQKVPPYRETRDYVQRITQRKDSGTPGRPAKAPTRIYRWVEVVDGREIVRYSDRPERRRAEPQAPAPAQPPAQSPPSR